METFIRVDKYGNFVAVPEDEIAAAADAFIGWLDIEDNDDNEELPAPPEEIPFNWDSIK